MIGAGSGVYSLAVSGSTVYAGGLFTTIGVLTRNRIAALDASTGSASAWNPNNNSAVNAVIVESDTIYVGGVFSTVGGNPRSGLAVWRPTTIRNSHRRQLEVRI